MIPVFYSPNQVVGDHLDSPSAGKPPSVLASWVEAGFPIQILEPTPATVDDFKRVHDPTFVDEILACRAPNGFGTMHKGVADSLPWTSGSMLSAARYLLATGSPVAVSPTSGFHHATYASAMGFCTFNGLMVTVLALRAGGFYGRVGIIDLDQHYGNGTDDIINRLPMEERSLIKHYTVGACSLKAWQAHAWLAGLSEFIDKSFGDCHLVLYQAGADPHVEDPYGGYLTTEQLYQRDQIVFRALRKRNVPVVWNLAGGYQTPLRRVLDIHDNTMRACTEAFIGA